LKSRAPTFGAFLEKATHLADAEKFDGSTWGARFFQRVLRDVESAGALGDVNHQRNNLAHGKKTLPLAQIKQLVALGLQLEYWERIPETDGELRLDDWRPWVVTPPTAGDHIGLFERWQKDKFPIWCPRLERVLVRNERSLPALVL
jgi:hypothetical protein